MKKILLYLSFSLFALNGINAQTAEKWHGILLSTDGSNTLNGVKAYYQLTTCDNIEYLFIKLINNNTYTVRAGWKDLIVTKENNRLSGNNAQDSLTIAPHAEIAGDCSGSNPQLVIKLSDFETDALEFKTFLLSRFDFIIIHQ
jgi:hypothetical protein